MSLEARDRRAGYVDVPDARRRGDRIAMFYAAVHESAIGTKRTFRQCFTMSAFGGKADIAGAKFLAAETAMGASIVVRLGPDALGARGRRIVLRL